MTSKSQANASDVRQVVTIILVSALLTSAAAIIIGMPTATSDLAIAIVILFAVGAGGLAYVVPSIARRFY